MQPRAQFVRKVRHKFMLAVKHRRPREGTRQKMNGPYYPRTPEPLLAHDLSKLKQDRCVYFAQPFKRLIAHVSSVILSQKNNNKQTLIKRYEKVWSNYKLDFHTLQYFGQKYTSIQVRMFHLKWFDRTLYWTDRCSRLVAIRNSRQPKRSSYWLCFKNSAHHCLRRDEDAAAKTPDRKVVIPVKL